MFDPCKPYHMPQTVQEAAERLLSDLVIQHLSALSHMAESEFDQLCNRVTPHLLEEFKIWQGNDALLDACISQSPDDTDPARVILDQVKKILSDFQGFLVIE